MANKTLIFCTFLVFNFFSIVPALLAEGCPTLLKLMDIESLDKGPLLVRKISPLLFNDAMSELKDADEKAAVFRDWGSEDILSVWDTIFQLGSYRSMLNGGTMSRREVIDSAYEHIGRKSIFPILGEIYGGLQLQRDYSHLDYAREKDLSNRSVARPDGLVYFDHNEQLFIHKVLESKLGTSRYSRAQANNYLESWQSDGLCIGKKCYAASQIFFDSANSKPTPIEEVTSETLRQKTLLVSTDSKHADLMPPISEVALRQIVIRWLSTFLQLSEAEYQSLVSSIYVENPDLFNERLVAFSDSLNIGHNTFHKQFPSGMLSANAYTRARTSGSLTALRQIKFALDKSPLIFNDIIISSSDFTDPKISDVDFYKKLEIAKKSLEQQKRTEKAYASTLRNQRKVAVKKIQDRWRKVVSATGTRTYVQEKYFKRVGYGEGFEFIKSLDSTSIRSTNFILDTLDKTPLQVGNELVTSRYMFEEIVPDTEFNDFIEVLERVKRKRIETEENSSFTTSSRLGIFLKVLGDNNTNSRAQQYLQRIYANTLPSDMKSATSQDKRPSKAAQNRIMHYLKKSRPNLGISINDRLFDSNQTTDLQFQAFIRQLAEKVLP